MSDLKAGDIVVVKSGGPEMTVQEAGNSPELGSYAACVWFDSKYELKTATFMQVALKKVGQ